MEKSSKLYGKLLKVVAYLFLSITVFSFVPDASAGSKSGADFGEIVKGIGTVVKLAIKVWVLVRDCSWCPWN
ncbi:hypothetical protein [Pasteuria penetrans]|uniref:hypothetical protein n=1 Tax=Pasteuria penetrans TaxID=86005 RepID=UPI0011EC561C|nr:hypothetical protein [Pasteuria penetrans]